MQWRESVEVWLFFGFYPLSVALPAVSWHPSNETSQLRQPSQKRLVIVATLIWPTLAPSEIPRGKLPCKAFIFGAVEITRNDVANQLISLQNLEGSSVGHPRYYE